MNSSLIAANFSELAAARAPGAFAPEERASSGAMSSALSVAQTNDSDAVPIDIATPRFDFVATVYT